MKRFLTILLLAGTTALAGIPFVFTDLNPPGTIAYYRWYGGIQSNALSVVTVSYSVPTTNAPFNFTNTFAGLYYVGVAGVSTNGIESQLSNLVTLYGPISMTLYIVNGTNIVHPGP